MHTFALKINPPRHGKWKTSINCEINFTYINFAQYMHLSHWNYFSAALAPLKNDLERSTLTLEYHAGTLICGMFLHGKWEIWPTVNRCWIFENLGCTCKEQDYRSEPRLVPCGEICENSAEKRESYPPLAKICEGRLKATEILFNTAFIYTSPEGVDRYYTGIYFFLRIFTCEWGYDRGA